MSLRDYIFHEEPGITLYCGDCRDVLPMLLDISVVVTDPPYGIAWRRGVNHASRSRSHSGIANDTDTAARDQALALLPAIPGIVFGSFYAPPPSSVRQVLVWHKPGDSGVVGSTTGFRRDAEPIFLVGPWPIRTVKHSSVLRVRGQFRGHCAKETEHPHAKPVPLLEMLLVASPRGTVLDPFAGSGTTMVAAKNLGRRAIGIEIEPRYCEIAVKRLRQEVLL